MSDKFGEWTWYDGNCQPVGDSAVVDVMLTREVQGHHVSEEQYAIDWDWDIPSGDDAIIAYRVKKEPVVEVKTETVRIDIFGSVPIDGVTKRNSHTVVLSDDFECTYTDGKLTKIHWEASDAN